MRNYIIHSLKITCFVTITLLMLSCGSNVKKNSIDFSQASKELDVLLRKANLAKPEKKNPLLLKASGILLATKRQEKAFELLIHIDSQYLDNLQQDTYHLYFAEALLSQASQSSTESFFPSENLSEKNKTSLNHLKKINKINAHSIKWQIRYFQTLSDSYLANNNYFESAKQRIELDDLIDEREMLAENNEKIWLALSQINPDFLALLINDFNSQRVNGWLELVLINQKWGDQPEQLLSKMDFWKLRYPLHPAMLIQPKKLQRLTSVKTFTPKNIAILLPLSGRFSRSGKMVRDGIIAAHYQITGKLVTSNITFYDTVKSLSGLTSYHQALTDGADFVIGPLSKKAIDEIVMQSQLTTPILFLNTSNKSTVPHQNIFQFVLSIEDEAIQAAYRAWENGYRKAITLMPDNQRGQRAQMAFKQYFEQMGGEVIDSQKYNNIKKLKADIQNLLRVNDSIQRKKKLEQILGRNIEYEMRRRKDTDFIFMLAQPEQARRIKPFINFYFALNLPVISTKRIFSGKINPHLDNDLNGIEFSDIPLYISQQSDILQTRKTLKAIDKDILKGSNGRLFSLGYDAYQLIPQLSKLQAFPDYRWYGLSGEIGIDEAGLVHRYLSWAKFKKGTPIVTKERLAPKTNHIRQPLSKVKRTAPAIHDNVINNIN